MDEKKRHFVIDESSIGFVGGNYNTDKGGMPLSAARRAAKILFRISRNEKHNQKWKKFQSSATVIKFTIRETTRGSEKHVYQYEAIIRDLKENEIKTIKRNDIEYPVTTKIVVKAAKYTAIEAKPCPSPSSSKN